tara:strand:- start:181 stop:432 length:252 start_codon:yes stop_codon:yes gene_type:complete
MTARRVSSGEVVDLDHYGGNRVFGLKCAVEGDSSIDFKLIDAGSVLKPPETPLPAVVQAGLRRNPLYLIVDKRDTTTNVVQAG